MNHMKRLILCSVAFAFGDFASAAAPNILFIVSEDNGPEMGCYGTPIRTPQPSPDATVGRRQHRHHRRRTPPSHR